MMKRIQLFEFEDYKWFPKWIRICLTRLMIVMHQLLHSEDELADLLEKALKESKEDNIIDLCSGSGGAMVGTLSILRKKPGLENLSLTLTDLYPDLSAAEKINDQNSSITYLEKPVDATNIDKDLLGLRTMICSFHHMTETNAKAILKSAFDQRKAIVIFEISDNSFPKFLWWISIPINFIMCFFISFLVRPITWKQVVFTYIIPIIPIFFAWDGAVSNARTYTLKDMDVLLEGLHSEHYTWNKGVIKGKSKKLYLIGTPV